MLLQARRKEHLGGYSPHCKNIFSWSHSRLSMGVYRILTTIPISLSLLRRQLLYHCAIHARPHLMAKAFRYLRQINNNQIMLIIIWTISSIFYKIKKFILIPYLLFFFSIIDNISNKVRFLLFPLPSGFKSYTNLIILINSSFSNLVLNFKQKFKISLNYMFNNKHKI